LSPPENGIFRISSLHLFLEAISKTISPRVAGQAKPPSPLSGFRLQAGFPPASIGLRGGQAKGEPQRKYKKCRSLRSLRLCERNILTNDIFEIGSSDLALQIGACQMKITPQGKRGFNEIL
jgi:hypothetical protein